jgi:hypothetical protein
MSMVAALLLWVFSPIAGTIGYLQVAIPAQLFRLSARLGRSAVRAVGLDSSAMMWPNTPLQRRLFGDPATALLFVILSVSAAVLGAVILATA